MTYWLFISIYKANILHEHILQIIPNTTTLLTINKQQIGSL